MLITIHVLSGALLGAATGRAQAALPLGVASHFALDAAPHWGKWDSDRHFLRVAVADGLSGLAVMAAAAALAPRDQRAAVVAGMVGAALPDLDKPARLAFGRSPFPKAVDDFHGRIQDEAPHRFLSHELPTGLLFAAAYGAACLIRRGARRRARA
ncbi:MAG: metal-dependent hydrolase [Actinocrinis sp.]